MYEIIPPFLPQKILSRQSLICRHEIIPPFLPRKILSRERGKRRGGEEGKGGSQEWSGVSRSGQEWPGMGRSQSWPGVARSGQEWSGVARSGQVVRSGQEWPGVGPGASRDMKLFRQSCQGKYHPAKVRICGHEISPLLYASKKFILSVRGPTETDSQPAGQSACHPGCQSGSQPA